MAYSKIEQAYLDGLIQNQFPDPVEPEPVLLAENTGAMPTQQPMTDTGGGAAVGARLNMPKGLNTPENMQAVGNDIPKTVAGVAKGMAQGFVGLPGDLEGIGRLVLNYMGADVNEQTKLPTTQDVKGFLDQYIKLPELQTGDMSNFETAGEWLAPGGQLKAIKPVAKAIKGAVKMTEGLPVGLSTKAVGQGVDELGFYSAVSKAADEIQQPKGTGEQFLAQISKTPGVKQDEIIWTGLDDFLKSKKTVTKQEVQDYLANNRVEVKEVRLGEGYNAIEKELNKNGYDLNVDMDGDWSIFKNNEYVDLEDLPNDLQKFVIENQPAKTETKFSKYTLPGGENYREVLLTLPSKNPEFDPKDIGRLNDLSNKTRTAAEDAEYKSLAQRYDASLRGETSPEFKSGHFDQPNILAHLRVNDRVDADGKKVLMVEEVQSDWHQAGRKRGYKNLDVEKQILDIEEQMSNLADIRDPVTNRIVDEEKFSALWRKKDELLKQMGPVPDAPFKTTWHELALKRAIQLASEGGYDRIAFTTGKTQAARYDLSKQIDDLTITRRDTDFSISATDKSGKPAIMTTVQNLKNLDEIIGKDLANKVKDDFANKSGNEHTYAGLDLQVGGEGMKGFYDQILPKFLDKYAKKWDAKTSQMNMFISPRDGSVQIQYIDVTPKMKESVLTKGQPLFAVGGAGAAMQQEDNK